MSKTSLTKKLRIIAGMGMIPALIYFVCYVFLTWPLICSFSNLYFSDAFDGLQNIWDIWWINKAVTELGQSPWHTTYLYYPQGITLLGHTLNPFNGFVGIILLRYLSLLETYNFIVIFSFVTAGLTAFYLAYYFTRSYPGSLIAGFIFTFSSYHFTHAYGHLNLVALEWIPLFLLFWFMLLSRPRVITAVICAFLLFLVLLCDYYYFSYCCLTSLIILIWQALRKKSAFFFLKRDYRKAAVVFLVLAIATSGIIVITFLIANRKDPFAGGHNVASNALDLLAPFIPGGASFYYKLTSSYWESLTTNFNESSAYMGLVPIFLLIYTWVKRKVVRVPGINLWYFISIFFAILSLGPVLHIWGRSIPYLRLPYALITFIFPVLKLSGMPVRMIIMTTLGVAVITATGFKYLINRKKYLIVLSLVLVLMAEYYPRPLPRTWVIIPDYIKFIKNNPGNYGIIDLCSRPPAALFYQIFHDKPMAFGYVSRQPESCINRKYKIMTMIRRGEYQSLFSKYNFRYLLVKPQKDIASRNQVPQLVYEDNRAKIYDIKISKDGR